MINEKDQWLSIVRPLLGGIRNSATWIRYYAREIVDKVRLLPYAPSFETMAKEDLDAAIKEAEGAIALMKEARDEYGRRPVG